MKILYIFIGIVTISFFSCGSSKTTVSPEETKALTELVNKKNFKIDVQWAYPQASIAMQQVSGLLPPGDNANSINLSGNGNFLTISGDSITSYLPFFGERRMGGGYNNDDGAIQFKGTMKNYKVEKNKKEGYDISFEAKSNAENFKVNITLFPNLRADLSLIGNSRSSIRYSGDAIIAEK